MSIETTTPALYDDWVQAIDPPEVIRAEACPYCGNKPEFVDSAAIYGRSYGMIYLCRPCDAYVGVHNGSNKPKGRLANAELRDMKKQAHADFDRLWKEFGMTRKEAYAWLTAELEIVPEHTHIGMFNCRMCQLTMDVIQLARDVGEF